MSNAIEYSCFAFVFHTKILLKSQGIFGPIFLQKIPIQVQAQRVLILYFCFFFKDDKAHNVHDKDIDYQNLITKPHTLS